MTNAMTEPDPLAETGERHEMELTSTTTATCTCGKEFTFPVHGATAAEAEHQAAETTLFRAEWVSRNGQPPSEYRIDFCQSDLRPAVMHVAWDEVATGRGWIEPEYRGVQWATCAADPECDGHEMEEED